MTEMVERAAAALVREMLKQAGGTMPAEADETTFSGWDDCVGLVRAVLEALREPTEEMVEAGASQVVDTPPLWECAPPTARAAWNAMIDAAIGGK